MSPADKSQRLDRFFAVHRRSALPATTQRRAVFDAIVERTDHPTAEQLYRAVRGLLPQISLTTVHRILNGFVIAHHPEQNETCLERTKYYE